jgi:protein required for attachment to host cells
MLSDGILVLNRTYAKLFKRNPEKKTPTLLKKLENPLGRERNHNMQTDRRGSERARIGSAKISFSIGHGNSNPHEDAAVQFVRKVARLLYLEKIKGTFQNLQVFADPHLTGLLRKCLDKKTMESIISWDLKNMTLKPING